MKTSARVVATVAGLVTVLAVQLLAETPSLAQSDAERECRRTVGRAQAAYAKQVLKVVEKCHKARSKGAFSPSVDCNDVVRADVTGKLARMRSKLRSALLKGDCASAAGVLTSFERCPSPAADADDGEGTAGIDSFDELADCLTALTGELVGQATARTLGDPAGTLRRGARICQKTIGRGVRRLLETYARERVGCQHDRDLSLLGISYGCGNFDGRGKIAKAADRLRAGIAARCALDEVSTLSAVEELDALDACGDSIADLQECVVDGTAGPLGAGMVAMAYEMPAECRAGSVVRISSAGTGSRLTASSFSGGWNGIGHDIDLTDRFRDAMRLDCDADCGQCTLGLDALDGTPDAYCRCASDPTIHCDTVGGPDVDDCGTANNTCNCFLGPPVAVSAGGAPACITVRIDEGHGGTIDIGRGRWESTLGLAAVLHLGTDLLRPCPVCEGDSLPRDGVRSGTCSGGTRAGQACDVNAVQPTFGPSSYDCPPVALTNISGDGLALDINMTTEPLVLPFELPCDTPGKMCPCRSCSGDTSIGCSSDATCAEAGAGTCTAGGGAGVQPNACANHLCAPDGVCVAGPTDRYCDGETYADGRGFIACLTDVDCSLLGAGACTLLEPRRCYPNPIATEGDAGFFGGIAGTVGCLGVTSSAVVNQATGLPGAIRVVLDFESDVRCQSDPNVRFEPPSGANCPAFGSTTTTTTLLPPLPCVASFPLCGGDCPAGQTCRLEGLICACGP